MTGIFRELREESMGNKIVAERVKLCSVDGEVFSFKDFTVRAYLFGYLSGGDYIIAYSDGSAVKYCVVNINNAMNVEMNIAGKYIYLYTFWDRINSLGALPVYRYEGGEDIVVCSLESEGKIRVLVDSVECALANHEKERMAYSALGERIKVRLTEDWVRKNFDKFILEDSKGLYDFQMERSKGELLRGLYRLYNEDYKASVARSDFCRADCGVRENKEGMGYDESIIPVREVSNFNACYNGVCCLLNDVDMVFGSGVRLIESGISVLDLSKCSDIASVTVEPYEGDVKRTIIMPSEASGFMGVRLKNLAVKGLSEVRIKSSKALGDLRYSGVGKVFIENCTGFGKLDIWIDDLLCNELLDSGSPVEIFIENTDLTELSINSNTGSWFSLNLVDLPNLRKLSVKTDACIGVFQSDSCEVNKLPLLEELYIESHGYEADNPVVELSRFKNLKCINLRICPYDNDQEYKLLIPRDCKIDVYGCPCTVYQEDFRYAGLEGRR